MNLMTFLIAWFLSAMGATSPPSKLPLACYDRNTHRETKTCPLRKRQRTQNTSNLNIVRQMRACFLNHGRDLWPQHRRYGTKSISLYIHQPNSFRKKNKRLFRTTTTTVDYYYSRLYWLLTIWSSIRCMLWQMMLSLLGTATAAVHYM